MVRRYDLLHGSPGRMFVAALIAMGALLPCLARAQPRVWLLGANVGPTSDYPGTFLDCADPTGTQRFYVYVESDVALANVDAVVLDFRIDSSWPYLFCGHDPAPALPPFWHFGEGECNEGGLVPSAEPPAITYGYSSLWRNQPAPASWFAAMADTGRENYGTWFLPPTPISLEPNRIYYAGQLQMPKCAGAFCPGCDASVIIWVTGAYAASGADAYSFGNTSLGVNITGVCAMPPPPDPVSFRARSGPAPKATAMSAASVCDPVPVRRETWGRLKLRYR